MAYTTFAGIPNQLQPFNTSTITGSLTSPISGSLYFQARNRQGFNLYSNPTVVSLSAGEGLEITLPTKTSEMWDIHEYIISFSPTNSILDAWVIATYPYYDYTVEPPAENDFPDTIELTDDEHWQTQVYITSSSSLPSNPVHGTIINNDEWGEYRYWDSFVNEWVKCYPQSFTTYITSTEGVNGFARDLQEDGFDTSIIVKSKYNLSGLDGEPILYWLRNDGDNSINKGQQVIISFSWAGQDISFLMAGNFDLTFRGFVEIETGLVDYLDESSNEMSGLNTEFSYNPATPFNLKKPLPSGYAYVMEIVPTATLANINNSLPSNAEVSCLVRFGNQIDQVTDIATMEKIAIKFAIALGRG